MTVSRKPALFPSQVVDTTSPNQAAPSPLLSHRVNPSPSTSLPPFSEDIALMRDGRHVSLLKIQGKEFEMEPLRLRSVRPFFWEDISLLEVSEREGVVLDSKIKVTKYLKGRVSASLPSLIWDGTDVGSE
jgi:hypothetical protein